MSLIKVVRLAAVLFSFLCLELASTGHVKSNKQVKKKKKVEEFVPPSKPNFDELKSRPPSALHTDFYFIEACKEMAG